MTDHTPQGDPGPPPSKPTPEALAGWCEAASRILRPLLTAPAVQARVRLVLQHLDPDYAPVLVRTLLQTDAELPLAALSALPRAVNVAIEAAAELARYAGTFPPALLGSVVAGLVDELRPQPLGEALGRAARLALSLPRGGGDPAGFWAALAAGFKVGYASPPGGGAAEAPAGTTALAAHLAGLASAGADLVAAHPELVEALAGPLAEALAKHPALLDQGLRPLLGPLHDALHDARATPEAPR